MARKTSSPSGESAREALARELEALRRAIRRAEPGSSREPGGEGSMLAVARLVRHMDLAQWDAVARGLDNRDWIAVPLDENAYPHLAHLQAMLEELSHETQHDLLTGLANRRAFERRLDSELSRARREHSLMSLAVLDLDDFKKVNDTFGHACGDEVLACLGRTLLTHKRAYDFAARIGGEEFALILPGAGMVKSQVMLERLLETFCAQEIGCGNGKRLAVSFSAGVATLRGQVDTDPAQLMAEADKALYEAKRLGKRRIVATRLPGEVDLHRTTMVHSDEKKILFFGTG